MKSTSRVNFLSLILTITMFVTGPSVLGGVYQDSLLQVLKQTDDPQQKASIYNDLFLVTRLNSTDTAESYLRLALELTENASDPALQLQNAHTLKNLGIANWSRGDFPSAIEYYSRADVIYQQIDNKAGIAVCKVRIGVIYYSFRDFDKAIEEFRAALSTYEQVGNIENYVSGLTNTYGNLGTCFREMNQLDSALHYTKKAVDLAKKYNLKGPQANNLTEAALVHVNRGEYDSARALLGYARPMILELDRNFFYALYYRAAAMLEDSLDHTDTAIDYAKKTFAYADQADMNIVKLQSATLLEDRLAARGKFDEAYIYKDEISKLQQLLFDRNKNKEVLQLEIARRDDRLLLEAQKNALKEQELSRKNILMLVALGISVLLLVVLVMLYMTVRTVKKSRRNIRAKNEELEKMNKVNMRLLTIISHDFKDQLQDLSSLIYLSKREVKSVEMLKGFLERIGAKMSNLGELMENVTKLSYVQLSGKYEEKLEEVQVERLVEEVNVFYKRILERKNLRIRLENKIESSVKLDIKVAQIVLRNLVSNALKYSPDGSEVVVRFEENESKYVLQVADHGPGVPEEVQKKLFTDVINSASGIGIGLKMVYAYLKDINAQISLRNYDKGALAEVQFVKH